MSLQQKIAEIPIEDGQTLRLAYLDSEAAKTSKDAPGTMEFTHTILLIHGFPQTSYQYRHVIDSFVSAGNRVIVPDYRGAGASSHPAASPVAFAKSTMALDLRRLMRDILHVQEKIVLVGHDIGGMVAYAYVSRYPTEVECVIWGECPLPGTRVYDTEKGSVAQFHFTFHAVPDLPEFLLQDRNQVREYLRHFFDKLSYNRGAISLQDLDVYTDAYCRPGAMRCAFEIYRHFERDATENRAQMKEKGKCRVRSCVISGSESRHKSEAGQMAREVFDDARLMVKEVPQAGHYVAEENPKGFVNAVLDFLDRQ